MSSLARRPSVRPHAVPVGLFVVVAAAVLVVPPLVLGFSARTYAITAAVLLLAVGSALPYALVVGLGTLPLLYAGLGSYATPAALPADGEEPPVLAALRHACAGVVYTLAAAAVGGVAVGLDFAAGGDATPLPGVLQPAFLTLGGVVVAAAFVGLQLWRYGVPVDELDRRRIAGTVALGLCLAPAPRVAFLVFDSGVR